MEPLNDQDLDNLLRQWHAPLPPTSLERKIADARRKPWWHWFLRGTIPIPVPLALAAGAIAFMLWASHSSHQTAARSEFQPVKQLVPRIIRSSL